MKHRYLFTLFQVDYDCTSNAFFLQPFEASSMLEFKQYIYDHYYDEEEDLNTPFEGFHNYLSIYDLDNNRFVTDLNWSDNPSDYILNYKL